MKYTKSLSFILFGLLISTDLESMIQPSPVLPAGPTLAGSSRSGLALSDFVYDGASVLPYTKWPSKPDNYFLLAREKYGKDRETYDAFGGAREPQDKFYDKKANVDKYHPINTAAREFSEESFGLFGNKNALLQHIDVIADKLTNTAAVIANRHKKFVVYISYFSPKDFDTFKNEFYKRPLGEKDRIAHVKESTLRDIIANAPRDASQTLIQPIKVWATVFEPNGTDHPEKIDLRPVFVSTLQSYFKGQQGTLGKVDRIHFYDR